jgi:hypothetical protein
MGQRSTTAVNDFMLKTLAYGGRESNPLWGAQRSARRLNQARERDAISNRLRCLSLSGIAGATRRGRPDRARLLNVHGYRRLVATRWATGGRAGIKHQPRWAGGREVEGSGRPGPRLKQATRWPSALDCSSISPLFFLYFSSYSPLVLALLFPQAYGGDSDSLLAHAGADPYRSRQLLDAPQAGLVTTGGPTLRRPDEMLTWVRAIPICNRRLPR